MLFSKSIAFDEKDLGNVASATGTSYVSNDLEFTERLKAGEPKAFDTLVTRYAADIYALLFRLTTDAEEAADLTQETFLRAIRAVGSFRGESELKTWLYRIAINESRNRFRWWKRRRRDKTFSLDENVGESDTTYHETIADTSISPEEETLRHERESMLQRALTKLPAIYREPIVLFDIEGLSYEEICETLSLNPGTLKSRLARRRRELKKLLSGF